MYFFFFEYKRHIYPVHGKTLYKLNIQFLPLESKCNTPYIKLYTTWYLHANYMNQTGMEACLWVVGVVCFALWIGRSTFAKGLLTDFIMSSNKLFNYIGSLLYSLDITKCLAASSKFAFNVVTTAFSTHLQLAIWSLNFNKYVAYYR